MEIQHAARRMGIRLIKHNANDYVAVDVRTNKVVKRSTNPGSIIRWVFKEGLLRLNGGGGSLVKVFACGGNSHGQLGLGDTNERPTFTAVPSLPDGKVAKQVVAGSDHTMILAEDGTVFACGRNDYGQLGLGDTVRRDTFTAVRPLPDGKVAKQVVAGAYHTMILTDDGSVFACGNNEAGQLGLGNIKHRYTFTEISPLSDGKIAKQVIPGGFHTMILAEDGTVFACGDNHYGQLGLGDFINDPSKRTFKAIPALPDNKATKQVVVGTFHTMILAEDGTVFACGRNLEGQLGLGDLRERNTFTAVDSFPGGKIFTSASSLYTMILAEDGTVFACGRNEFGQLGLGGYVNRRTFTAVPSLPVAKQVVAGREHVMILTQDGTVFACGRNDNGQLGLGDTSNRHTFTAVPRIPKGVTAIAAGGRHTLFIQDRRRLSGFGAMARLAVAARRSQLHYAEKAYAPGGIGAQKMALQFKRRAKHGSPQAQARADAGLSRVRRGGIRKRYLDRDLEFSTRTLISDKPKWKPHQFKLGTELQGRDGQWYRVVVGTKPKTFAWRRLRMPTLMRQHKKKKTKRRIRHVEETQRRG